MNRTLNNGASFPGLYGMWVNDMGLALVSSDIGAFQIGGSPTSIPIMPSSPFPFSRLAGYGAVNSLFVYHQINASTFMEETWDNSMGGWVSNKLVVGTV